ncbi:hypothetical protein ACQJBY_021166 [Aegilops geniculata]
MARGEGVMFCWATVGRPLRADGGGGGPKALDGGASRARVAARPATASYVAAGVDWLGGAATAVPRSCNHGRRKLEPWSSGDARLLHAGEGVLQPWPRKAGSVVRRSYNQVRWSCKVNQSFLLAPSFFAFATTVSSFAGSLRCFCFMTAGGEALLWRHWQPWVGCEMFFLLEPANYFAGTTLFFATIEPAALLL